MRAIWGDDTKWGFGISEKGHNFYFGMDKFGANFFVDSFEIYSKDAADSAAAGSRATKVKSAMKLGTHFGLELSDSCEMAMSLTFDRKDKRDNTDNRDNRDNRYSSCRDSHQRACRDQSRARDNRDNRVNRENRDNSRRDSHEQAYRDQGQA